MRIISQTTVTVCACVCVRERENVCVCVCTMRKGDQNQTIVPLTSMGKKKEPLDLFCFVFQEKRKEIKYTTVWLLAVSWWPSHLSEDVC